MNCPNCGMPISDGSKFCNSCGAQTIAPVQTQNPTGIPTNIPTYQPPVQTVAPQPEPPKKKNTGLIIGAVVAVAVIVVAFCILGFVKPGFLLKEDETTTKSEETSSVSENEEQNSTSRPTEPSKPEPTQPAINLTDAESHAKAYYETISTFDLITLCDSEIIGWSSVEKIIEDLLIESVSAGLGYTMSIDAIYNILSGELNYKIEDAEDFFKAYLQSAENPTNNITCTVMSSKVITESEAKSYSDKTKAEIDKYNAVGLNSSDYNWDDFEAYAEVDCLISKDSNNDSMTTILGLRNGKWVVLYANSADGSSNCLGSLSFVEGMLESI